MVYNTQPTFLVRIPKELYKLFGKPLPGTLIYYTEGMFEDVEEWYRGLQEIVGDVVSVPNVTMFVPVSRNMVHKRIKMGKLSCFQYSISNREKAVLSKNPYVREMPHAFVPVVECEMWRIQYQNRWAERGLIKTKRGPRWIKTKEGYFKPRIAVKAFKKYSRKWKEDYLCFKEDYFLDLRRRIAGAEITNDLIKDYNSTEFRDYYEKRKKKYG